MIRTPKHTDLKPSADSSNVESEGEGASSGSGDIDNSELEECDGDGASTKVLKPVSVAQSAQTIKKIGRIFFRKSEVVTQESSDTSGLRFFHG